MIRESGSDLEPPPSQEINPPIDTIIFMNKLIKKDAAKLEPPALTREERAIAILNKKESKLPYYLAPLASPGICNFLINNSEFNAPILVRVFISTSIIGVVLILINNTIIRRKLDAAIELLLIQEKRQKID